MHITNIPLTLRKKTSFSVSDVASFKHNLLCWGQKFDEIAWLDNNGHTDRYGSFDALLAVDSLTSLITDYYGAFRALTEYRAAVGDWIFGFLGYDLKNDVEPLFSKNGDGLHFPDLYFFQPKKIIRIIGETVDFMYLNLVADEIKTDFEQISAMGTESSNSESLHAESSSKTDIRIKLRIFKDEYFIKIKELLAHIYRGDVYEANLCQEFYAENIQIDPYRTYLRLNAISKTPFATYFKMGNKFLLSASPERYLCKTGNTVVSQPIKGTARRSEDILEDAALRYALEHDVKERSENIMIVDLVRNDLSKSALKGSVEVKELCKVYSFEQVHQMISTVTAKLSEDTDPVHIVKENFPMGSMTGAPKISAMNLIEELESFKRGLYSGTVGYFTPEGDFDFNVVIRSILYNAPEQYVSYAVGSAITAKSIPEKEYAECLLKARAMRKVLESSSE